MKCGNCKKEHETAQEVKDCYSLGTPVSAQTVKQAIGSVPMATQKQLDFLSSLAVVRPKWAKERKIKKGEMTKRQASELIQEALATPAERTRDETLPNVPEGYYAIDIDGTVKFYRVTRPTEGKWKGRLFVSVQASDDFYSVKNKEKILEILEAILDQGVKISQARYGKEIGRCGICNRTLTDEVSIARGIGPVCLGKWG
jgi:Family of unknown function (DUF6011)